MFNGLSICSSVIFMDSSEIPLCHPPLSLPFEVRRIWYFIALIFNVITIVSYLVGFTVIHCKYKNPYCTVQIENVEIERKAMKSFPVIIIFFLYSQFVSTFLANFIFFNYAGYSKELIERAQAFMIFPAMACYSSTFYVCFVRSCEYRRIFWSQMVKIFESFVIILRYRGYLVEHCHFVSHTCFRLLSLYIFTNCVQMGIMAAISTDMLISIAFPFRHRSWRRTPYLTSLVLPGIIYGATVLIIGLVSADTEEIKLCQPPSSLPFQVRKVW
ncbi:hypothetical protein PMAYCL1PPCAC_12973, partial [Pristionchus mayeri]